MSEENVEIVRQGLGAFIEGDIETALSVISEEVEWDGTNLPDGEIAIGHKAILDHVARWAAMWDEWTVEIERIGEADRDQVIVFVRERGLSAQGLRVNEVHAELYELKNGKIIRRRGFSDPREALQVAGLSE